MLWPGSVRTITPPAIPHRVKKIASSPADSARAPTCSASRSWIISSSPTSAATASPIRAGLVYKGLGPDQPEHPDHRGRRECNPNHCRPPSDQIRRKGIPELMEIRGYGCEYHRLLLSSEKTAARAQ